jgi:hypothetical protein
MTIREAKIIARKAGYKVLKEDGYLWEKEVNDFYIEDTKTGVRYKQNGWVSIDFDDDDIIFYKVPVKSTEGDEATVNYGVDNKHARGDERAKSHPTIMDYYKSGQKEVDIDIKGSRIPHPGLIVLSSDL